MRHQRTWIVVRWLAVLPGALLASILVSVINSIGAGLFINTEGVLFQAYLTLMSGGAFVYAASWIAPAHSLPTAIVAAVLYGGLAIFATSTALMFPGMTSLSLRRPWEIWLIGIAGLVGSCGVCIGLYLDEHQRADDQTSALDI